MIIGCRQERPVQEGHLGKGFMKDKIVVITGGAHGYRQYDPVPVLGQSRFYYRGKYAGEKSRYSRVTLQD